jgi:hypothetical protein
MVTTKVGTAGAETAIQLDGKVNSAAGEVIIGV